MPEIPAELEALLRRQGVTEAQLAELRESGRVQMVGSSVTIDGAVVSSNGADLPPEALAQLRRVHRFMPKGTVEQIEMSTGQDIDGDGIVGPVPEVGGVAAHDSAQHMAQHAVEATSNASGPFVRTSPARSYGLPILLVVVGAGSVIAYLATR